MDANVQSHIYNLSTADPAPPTGMSVDVTGCDSVVVTWMASMSMFDTTIGNYSVRYQLRSGSDGLTTLHEPSTSVTLQGLAPNAEYNVSVAGINSCGGTSTFTMTQFNLQGMYVYLLCLQGINGHYTTYTNNFKVQFSYT